MSDTFAPELDRFEKAFTGLFTLIDALPVSLREEPGVTGWWSSREIMAHLSGWLTVADWRYTDMDTGHTASVKFDIDAVNAQSVKDREHYTWEQLRAELREKVTDLIHRARLLTPAQLATTDIYEEWLREVGRDCEVHTQELREFLTKHVPHTRI